jgi:hypothetical protein
MSLVTKRLLNRWVLSLRLRRILMRPLSRIMERYLEQGLRTDQGGLVFLALERGAAT